MKLTSIIIAVYLLVFIVSKLVRKYMRLEDSGKKQILDILLKNGEITTEVYQKYVKYLVK